MHSFLLLLVTQTFGAATGNINSFVSCMGQQVTNQLVLPNFGNYSFISTGERERVQRYPIGILLVQTQPDIQKSVKCAYETGVRIVPRGGGYKRQTQRQ